MGHPLFAKRTPKTYRVRVFFTVSDTKWGRGYSDLAARNDEQGGTPYLGEKRSVIVENAKSTSDAQTRMSRYLGKGIRVTGSEYLE